MEFIRCRRNLLTILSAVVFFSDTSVFAHSFYKSGKVLAAENREIVNKEDGFFVRVPVDYEDSAKGFTDIYAYFRKKFNPSLPTFVLFTGGPGGSSHFSSDGVADIYARLDYNFLLFDQRGIAFSRPESEKLWLDPSFYSSVNNARDLEEIRKFLKLDKISVFGTSYGTVPATIYGHLFPRHTRSVILEGVVFDGTDVTLQESQFLIRVIQQYFDSLSPNARTKLNLLSNDVWLPKMWFPSIVQSYLTASGTQDLPELTALLESASLAADNKFLEKFNEELRLKHESKLQSKSIQPEFMNFQEDLVNIMLMSKEFGSTRTNINNHFILENGKVKGHSLGHMSPYVIAGKQLGLPVHVRSTFSAANYPLEVPVYYIGGNKDGATIPAWLMKHWKSVPQAEAYLLVLKQGGHSPGAQIFTSSSHKTEQARQFLSLIFKAMLDAKPLSKEQIETWNSKGQAKISFAAKRKNSAKCEMIF